MPGFTQWLDEFVRDQSALGVDTAGMWTFTSNGAFTPADVTSADDVGAAVAKAREHLGGVNVLVNCAGIGTAMKTFGRNGPAKLEEFTRVIHVNLIGTFNCIRLVAGEMAKEAPGAAGERGGPRQMCGRSSPWHPIPFPPTPRR